MDQREYHRQYYLRNKEKLKTRSKEFYEKNSDAVRQLSRVRSQNRTPEQMERDAQYHRDWYEKNRERQLAKAKEAYDSNPEPFRRKVRIYRTLLPDDVRKILGRKSLLNKFHTTEAWYEAKLAEQGNHCALCPREREENGNRLAIDHNHKCCAKSGSCGKCLRGILCRRCNVRLGHLDDFLSLGMAVDQGHHSGWFAKAIDYLKKYEIKNRGARCLQA